MALLVALMRVQMKVLRHLPFLKYNALEWEWQIFVGPSLHYLGR